MNSSTKLRRPIGIFDSGVGGLTVAHAIHQNLPNEDLLYFGDTIHFPFGDKSEVAIREYSVGISEFLIENNCKAIVIACNTASSFGFEAVRELAETSGIPVINVIDPVVEYVSEHYSGRTIGVIGTRGTITSNVYQRKINAIDPSIDVRSLATPLLASVVEEGLLQNAVSHTAVDYYLRHDRLNSIEAIILACTHYPLLKHEVTSFYRGKVEVIDSAEIVAKYTASLFDQLGLHNNTGHVPNHQFYLSDLTTTFEPMASLFFRESIQLRHLNIWNRN